MSEDEPIHIDHPLVPEAIREAAMQFDQAEDSVLIHRPCRDGEEWWLLSEEGELLDIFLLN